MAADVGVSCCCCMCLWMFTYMSCSMIAQTLQMKFLHVCHMSPCDAACCHFPLLFIFVFSGSSLTKLARAVVCGLSWCFPWLGWFSSTTQRPWADMSKMVQNNSTSQQAVIWLYVATGSSSLLFLVMLVSVVWSRLKYLNYYMDCHEILHKHSWSLENKSYWFWWAPDFASINTMDGLLWFSQPNRQEKNCMFPHVGICFCNLGNIIYCVSTFQTGLDIR